MEEEYKSLNDDYNFKRLSLPDEKNWDDVINRFINEMVKRKVKTSREDMEWLLLNYYALPNSPALLTSGRKKFFASACSSYPIQDSMADGVFSILNTLKLSSVATKAGIGTGFNFSALRSKKELVADVGNATGGPVSFLKAYSGFGKEITQNMRKKASMGLLEVNHVDIKDFIKVKEIDGNLEDFNLSIILNDEFMNSVKNDKDYKLKFITTDEFEVVKARELFDLIVKRIWDNGEPGIFFGDHIINDYFEKLETKDILANPCFHGDTLILTKDGDVPIKELVGKTVEIDDGNIWRKIDNFRVTGENQELLKITTKDGSELKVTPYHTIILERDYKLNERVRLKAKDLKIGDKLHGVGNPKYDDFEVISIEPIGKVDKVYCCTVDGTNSIRLSNNIITGNCSEALLSYSDEPNQEWLELCVLGSINIPKYMKLSIDDQKRVVDVLTRVLNDIIDVQDYPSELQRKGMQDINRKIGIGIAGLATYLATNNIKFSSNQCELESSSIFKQIGEFAEESSAKLGGIKDLGRYNASLLSVAPTSTLSNIFNYHNKEGCSYGIEPFFSTETVTIKNSFGEFKKTPKIVKYLNSNVDHIETANELTYKEHLNPIIGYYNSNKKGIVQGCSKTINFKNNVTVEDIKEAIMYCWENKIKAISFYRDGSRENQVISTKDSYNSQDNSRKRPKELPCEIHHLTSNKQKWVVFISLFNNKPFELFAGLQKSVELSKKHTKGKIIKKGKKNYQLELEDETVINKFNQVFEDEHNVTTRLVSMSLRHGVEIKYLVDQLLKDGSMMSVNKCIARILKKYIPENEDSGQLCPKCEGKMLFISGCKTCKDCKFSFCG